MPCLKYIVLHRVQREKGTLRPEHMPRKVVDSVYNLALGELKEHMMEVLGTSFEVHPLVTLLPA